MKKFNRLLLFISFLLVYSFAGFFFPLVAQENSTDETLNPSSTETTSLMITQDFSTFPSVPEMTDVLTVTHTDSWLDITITADSLILNTEITAEATISLPELTEEAPEETATILAQPPIVSVTAETTDADPVAESTATPDRVMVGRVQYQAGESHAGILVQSRDATGWETWGITDEAGIYRLEVLSTSVYWLEFSAPLYASQTLQVVAGDSPALLILEGGDINNDGCINQIDLDALLLYYRTQDADIDRNGITDASDLAILTGNYDSECVAELIEAEETQEVMPETVPETQ